MGGLEAWVKRCRDERGAFNLETAKAQLRDIWKFEVALLRANPEYSKLWRARSLGEMYPTESNAVVCDYLGHLTLCMLRAPRWREYVVGNHASELATVASMGSWSAKELLGLAPDFASPLPSDEELASRFFFGDVPTLQALRAAYQ
jgi:hypothetical protein